MRFFIDTAKVEDIKKANDVISQTQTSVQVLKDSISSKVSKTEILSDNELREALKGRDGVGIKKIVVETAYSTDDVAPTYGWQEVM